MTSLTELRALAEQVLDDGYINWPLDNGRGSRGGASPPRSRRPGAGQVTARQCVLLGAALTAAVFAVAVVAGYALAKGTGL